MYPEQTRYLAAKQRVARLVASLVLPEETSIEQRDQIVLKSGYWQAVHALRASELALLDFGSTVVLPAIGVTDFSSAVIQRGCPNIYRKSILELLAVWGIE